MVRYQEFDAQAGSEKTVATLGDRWWPQAAKKEGDEDRRKFRCNTPSYANNVPGSEHPNIGGVSNKSRNGASSRERCVANGQMTKASNKNDYPSPPAHSKNACFTKDGAYSIKTPLPSLALAPLWTVGCWYIAAGQHQQVNRSIGQNQKQQ